MGRATPFQLTVDAATKSLPSIITVNAGLPAATTPGVSDETDGVGFGVAVVCTPATPHPHTNTRAVTPTAASRQELKIAATDPCPLECLAHFILIF